MLKWWFAKADDTANGHDWHKTWDEQRRLYRQQCCWCGEWRDGIALIEGHGPYAYQDFDMNTLPCTGRTVAEEVTGR